MDAPLLEVKLSRLDAQLVEAAPMLVAYSGGVDSAFLLARARHLLGRDGVTGMLADSPSLPRKALAAALELACSLDVQVEVLKTAELDNPDYASNPPNRCYFCKAELFRMMEQEAAARGCAALAYGENADDAEMVRPGADAAREFRVLAPLRDAGLRKSDIRELSRREGLPTADAPSQPCLSSRIPWGTPVTPEALGMVERAEDAVRALGFRVFRVRHIASPGSQATAPTARLAVDPAEMSRLQPLRSQIESAIRAAGYAALEIDPAGYTSPARHSKPAELNSHPAQ